MEKIKVNNIEKEVERIKKAIKGFRRMDKECIENLEREGFQFMYLGTGFNSYINSMRIDIIDTRKNKIYKNENLFLCIGICCEKYGKGSLYRAYAKEIENTATFAEEQVEELRKRL